MSQGKYYLQSNLLSLVFSNSRIINRKLALIPDSAVKFSWIYPTTVPFILDTIRRRTITSRTTATDDLLMYGGYLYLDKAGAVVAVNAVTALKTAHVLQFGLPQPLPEAVSKALKRANRCKSLYL